MKNDKRIETMKKISIVLSTVMVTMLLASSVVPALHFSEKDVHSEVLGADLTEFI